MLPISSVRKETKLDDVYTVFKYFTHVNILRSTVGIPKYEL